MKITGSQGTTSSTPVTGAETTAAGPSQAPVVAVVPLADTPLQSAGLQKASAELAALPEIDQSRVAALKEAIVRGEMPFDAAKLAGLIERYHRSRS